MDYSIALVVLISLYSRCHGAYPNVNKGYLPPSTKCIDKTITKTSTMFVTETSTLAPYINTRVLEPDTSIKPMAQHTTTTVTTLDTYRPKHNITIYKHPDSCENKLPPKTVTNTIPVYTTEFLEPITITKASRMMVWMTVPPVINTVVVTSTVKEEAKLKISVSTSFSTRYVGPDTITMTLPITITEYMAPMTSTIKDHNVHTTTLPAATITLKPTTIMKPPETVISTVIITHTKVIAPDTKMVTWTVTQMVNKECAMTYMYNMPPKAPFRHGKSLAKPPAPIIAPVEQTVAPVVN